ncbi:hypothetical protein ACFSY7_03315 [Kurthia populi]|uniref:DUF4303 domain-containing protein n=1 Tax=Kurthia populi TaxID=1562132 RepID=A0ABW5XWZ6_9BACL
MFSVESYVEEVRGNLEKQAELLINAFKNVENLKFPEDACVLVIDTSFSYNTGFYLAVNEDMFNSVDPVEDDSDDTSSVKLLTNFALYDEDSKNFNEKEEEMFSEFYSDNGLEGITIKEYGHWVKKCFDEAKITLNVPIYFRILDEEDALNLVTGEWEDQMEIEL